MPKFRKKPVIIHAMQFTGTELSCRAICNHFGEEFSKVAHYDTTINSIVIETLEGNMWANKGDWIIKGVKGEFYPCKSDIFEQTYEKVEE